MMSLASEQPDGVAGLPVYGPYPRHRSPSISIFTAFGEPEEKELKTILLLNLSPSWMSSAESQVHVKKVKVAPTITSRQSASLFLHVSF